MYFHETPLFLLLFLCFSRYCLAEELPSFIHVCHRNDPNIKECLVASVEDIRPYLIKGVPEYNIPSLEPLVIKDFFSEEAAGMKLKISDVNAWGASDFFVRGLKVDLEKQMYVIDVDIPKLRVDASYMVDGKLLMVPVNGQGHMDMNLTDVSGKAELQGIIFDKDGEKHIRYDEIQLKIDVKTGSILLTNTAKDKILMQILNDMVNKNFKMFINEFMPPIEKKLKNVFLEISNAIVGPFTYDQLFPE